MLTRTEQDKHQALPTHEGAAVVPKWKFGQEGGCALQNLRILVEFNQFCQLLEPSQFCKRLPWHLHARRCCVCNCTKALEAGIHTERCCLRWNCTEHLQHAQLMVSLNRWQQRHQPVADSIKLRCTTCDSNNFMILSTDHL